MCGRLRATIAIVSNYRKEKSQKWLRRKETKSQSLSLIEMQGNVARELLGFPPNSRPTLSQVKAAYKRKALESHPDRFPAHEKLCAESKFKLISEAYSFLQAGMDTRGGPVQVFRGVKEEAMGSWLKLRSFLLILGTVGLGGLNATRAYQRQRDAYPSHNPFLP